MTGYHTKHNTGIKWVNGAITHKWPKFELIDDVKY